MLYYQVIYITMLTRLVNLQLPINVVWFYTRGYVCSIVNTGPHDPHDPNITFFIGYKKTPHTFGCLDRVLHYLTCHDFDFVPS